MAVVDAVIVSYNSAETLRGCVLPLAENPLVEVVVVDNRSTDGALATIADLSVTTIAENENGGFARGCNRGWREGTAPYVLFLNPDARLDVGSLDRLVACLEADATVGAAAPRILGADGTLDWSLRRFPRLRSTYAQALFLHRLFPAAAWTDESIREPALYERPCDPEWASGACLLVRRTALEAVGGWDDGFFLYCEDKDLCRRLWSAGFRVRYEPGAVCSHVGGASGGGSSLLPVLAASRIRYAQKHRSAPAALAERLGIALGALTHSAVSRGGESRRSGHLRAFARALSA